MENIEEKILKEAEARVSFKRHLRTYLVINVLIWAFWYVTRARFGQYDGYWPVYSSLGWGIGILSHYMSVYKNDDNAIQKEVEKIKKERRVN